MEIKDMPPFIADSSKRHIKYMCKTYHKPKLWLEYQQSMTSHASDIFIRWTALFLIFVFIWGSCVPVDETLWNNFYAPWTNNYSSFVNSAVMSYFCGTDDLKQSDWYDRKYFIRNKMSIIVICISNLTCIDLAAFQRISQLTMCWQPPKAHKLQRS